MRLCACEVVSVTNGDPYRGRPGRRPGPHDPDLDPETRPGTAENPPAPSWGIFRGRGGRRGRSGEEERRVRSGVLERRPLGSGGAGAIAYRVEHTRRGGVPGAIACRVAAHET